MLLTVLDFQWFWSVLDCTFLLKDYMAILASMKFATADLWSWKKGFKSLNPPCLYMKLEFWESYKQAKNLSAQIWRNLPSSIIRDSPGMEISFKMLLNSMYPESKSWKPEATQYSVSWTVKCRTWGYAYTPEHDLQLDKFQAQILQRDAITSVSWGGSFHTAHKLTWWTTTSVHIWNHFLFFIFIETNKHQSANIPSCTANVWMQFWFNGDFGYTSLLNHINVEIGNWVAANLALLNCSLGAVYQTKKSLKKKKKPWNLGQ